MLLYQAICDEENLTCRGCDGGSECTSRLCNSGICGDTRDIVYVDKATGADGVNCGTVADPCASIGSGIEKVEGTRE
ncbi:MAG: hypothetical protein GY811_25420 [Myxococcales bacterium]|nr:hypothetical protein [Myxococcales bacterium]